MCVRTSDGKAELLKSDAQLHSGLGNNQSALSRKTGLAWGADAGLLANIFDHHVVTGSEVLQNRRHPRLLMC